MNVDRYLRLLAGSFVLVSVALGWFVSPWFFLLTVFVAVNQIQSAFTNWCPAITFLKKAGVPEGASCSSPSPGVRRVA